MHLNPTPSHKQKHEGGCDAGEIKLATFDSNSYLNVIAATSMYQNLSLTAASARWLRDELNRIYPLPVVQSSPSPAPKRAAPKRAAPNGPQAYRGNGNHSWEEVEVVGLRTKRLRVPGGWLYRNDISMVFVPTPDVTGYKI